MARYGRGRKPRTRARIVGVAARRFREKGYGGAGVDDVMRASGLTAGGFYAHFRSKEVLLAETFSFALSQTRARLLGAREARGGADWLSDVVRRYLSRSHRDDVADGCVLPSLAAEVARCGRRTRRAFELYLTELSREMGAKTPSASGLTPEDRALATLALGAGGILLARAVLDPGLSERILRVCRRLALPDNGERSGDETGHDSELRLRGRGAPARKRSARGPQNGKRGARPRPL